MRYFNSYNSPRYTAIAADFENQYPNNVAKKSMQSWLQLLLQLSCLKALSFYVIPWAAVNLGNNPCVCCLWEVLSDCILKQGV
ncbi:hypothetical protein UPYG_G00342550 [Umbra pygmaea]|uniref:Uncharacterized protein n=1 Tax=Umbra pygmaea TaxID=75934 RepID=A0ABD0VXB6_UMBPY